MMRVVERYLQEINENGSPEDSTCRVYRNTIDRVERFLGRPIETATKDELRAWRTSITDKSANTQHSYISTIRSFFDWLTVDAELREDNPARILRPPKQQRGTPRAVDPKFIAEAMLYATETGQPDARLGIGLSYFGGVRTCETCRLRQASIIDWPKDLLALDGKGNKRREIPYTDAIRIEMELHGISRTGFILKRRDHSNGPVRANRLTHIISRVFRDIGTQITNHQGRHTFATLTAEKASAAEIRVVQNLLGHASLTTTQIYVGADMNRAEALMNQLPSHDALGLPRQRTTNHRFQVINGGRA